jgi:hypothetical protein
MGQIRPVSAHCLFVIPSFQGWKLSEFLTDDSVGVIERWFRELDDEVRAQIEARLLQWVNVEKFVEACTTAVEPDTAGKRFEELQDIRSIEVQHGGVVYRILGSSISIWEFVMLIGDMDDRRRGKIGADVKKEARERLHSLQAHPGKRREYKI